MSIRSRARNLMLHLLAAAAVGVVVAGTAYLCAYYEMRGAVNYRLRQDSTEHYLSILEEAIAKHRQATSHLPADLAELKEVKEEQQRFKVDAEGRVLDIWGHPYQYRIEGDRFTLYSFGRDGQPGGEGLDADLYSPSAGRPRELPTLRQFTFELPTQGVQWTCFLAGVCAGLVCLLPSRNRRGAGFLALLGATSIGAILFAVVISSLHIPSGH